jgi:molecular chaperone DnaK
VNPDEVVAVGAAIQAGVLGGEVKDVLLLDVTPLSLGVETMGGVFTKLIERNTTIPVQKSETFSTAADGQPAVDIHVLQGERPMAADNMSLGNFQLQGIAPAPRGTPQIEVTFDIDANGIINVTATDKATGKAQKITVTASTNLKQGEIDRLVREADQHRAEDEKARELAQARNEADTLIYQAEKAINSVKLNETDRATIEQQIKDTRDAAASSDVNRIREAAQALQNATYALSQQMYNDNSAANGGSANPNGQYNPNGEDVVEGDFTEA